jgi:membrane protease YdiL (CAAX protease family)
LNQSSPDQSKWTWQDVVFIPLGFGIFFFLGWLALGFVLGQSGIELSLSGEPTLAQTISLAALETIALVASVYILGMLRHGLSWRQVGIRQIESRWITTAIVISLLAIPITGLITLLVLQAFDLPFENPQLEFFLPEGISAPGALGVLIVGGITVPFAEELFFRGVLYTWLRKHWGMWPSVLASAFIFGLVHVDIAVGVTAFALGVVLGLVYEYSRTLWTPFLIHALNNSLRLMLLYVLVAFGLMPNI